MGKGFLSPLFASASMLMARKRGKRQTMMQAAVHKNKCKSGACFSRTAEAGNNSCNGLCFPRGMERSGNMQCDVLFERVMPVQDNSL